MKPYFWLPLAVLLGVCGAVQAQSPYGPGPYAAGPRAHPGSEAAARLREGMDKLLAFLAQEENDDDVLNAVVWRLVEKGSFRLRHMRKGTRHLSLTLHYSDGVTATRSVQLASPENHETVLVRFAADLFRKACRRRIRIRSLRLV